MAYEVVITDSSADGRYDIGKKDGATRMKVRGLATNAKGTPHKASEFEQRKS